MSEAKKADKCDTKLKKDIKHTEKKDHAFIGTVYQAEKNIKRIDRDVGHNVHMPVINEINISLIESVETVSVIHFVIIVDAIKCAPDKNKADNKKKNIKGNGKPSGIFHGNKHSCSFLAL